MSSKLVQITDLHLFQDASGLLAGVPTWDTFRAILDQIDRQHSDFDALIITGDIAQDEQPRTYHLLREALGERLARCRLIPGNHDSRPGLKEAFPELFPAAARSLTFEWRLGAWKIIGLDSQVTGEVYGGMDSEQRDWLGERLAAEPEMPTLIFVHHPPIAIDVAWLDRPPFRDAQALIALVEASPQVKVVCAGHVHQAFEGRIGAAQMLTTPSTCVQFAKRAEMAFDTSAAGYRTFHLSSDGARSEVHRLAAPSLLEAQ